VGRRLVVALACVAMMLGVPRWSAAASTTSYSAFARTRITPPEPNIFNWEQAVPFGTPPATAGTLTLFYGRNGPGTPCPDPSTVDYLCWRAYGAAEGATMHAAARVTRKNTTGPVSDIAIGYAAIAYENMNLVSAVPVVSGVVFLGLGGGSTATGGSGSIIVTARPEVYVNETGLECLGGICEPFPIPNFDGSYLKIELRALTTIGADAVPVDANADADYVDTLTVQAIELRDASGQKIPDAVVTLTDQSDNVTFTFPNAVPATTTTIAGATTTVPGGGTTTTTTLAGCEPGATYASIQCRLAALTVLVKGSAGKLAPKLGKLLTKATGGVQKAARLGATARTAAKGLRKAAHALQAYDKMLGSKKATKTLDDATRTSLRAAGAAIATDVAILQQALSTTARRGP
jgi:hypothetical protein